MVKEEEKMITMIIAEGANNLEIPCLVMENVLAAQKLCNSLGMEGTKTRYVLPDMGTDEYNKALDTLFTSYYLGCGEPYAIKIKEIDFNIPFVGWDLD